MPRILLITILLLPISAIAAPDFSREVLPILSDNCFKCHGPDTKARRIFEVRMWMGGICAARAGL